MNTVIIDDNGEKASENKYFHDKIKLSKQDKESRLLFLSTYWSAFDYDLLSILVKAYAPKDKKLKDQITKYKKMFKTCSIQSFVSFFKDTTFELDENSEVELKVRVKNNKTMKDVKKKVCVCLQDVLKISHLRWLRMEDNHMFVFGATFASDVTPLNKMGTNMLKRFKDCGIIEIKLQKKCLYGLDGKKNK